MRNTETAELLDRVRDTYRELTTVQREVRDRLADSAIAHPGGTVQRSLLGSNLARLTEAMVRLDTILDAAKIMGIPTEDLKVACGDDVDAFWDLFDAYRSTGKS